MERNERGLEQRYDRNSSGLSTRRPGFFSPWANDYWEPSRFLDNFFESDLSELGHVDTRFISPAMDLEETKKDYVLTADLPGVKKEDISIDCTGNQLVIRAERRVNSSDDEVKQLGRRERFYGTYQRTFTLPQGVDPEKIQASFDAGELCICIPKGANMKSKKINIEDKGFFSKMKH